MPKIILRYIRAVEAMNRFIGRFANFHESTGLCAVVDGQGRRLTSCWSLPALALS